MACLYGYPARITRSSTGSKAKFNVARTSKSVKARKATSKKSAPSRKRTAKSSIARLENGLVDLSKTPEDVLAM
jgi:hypothetical protein